MVQDSQRQLGCVVLQRVPSLACVIISIIQGTAARPARSFGTWTVPQCPASIAVGCVLAGQISKSLALFGQAKRHYTAARKASALKAKQVKAGTEL